MLKVMPKSASNWKAYDTAVVGVSLGSRNHTGPAFAGLMDWVGRHFDSCIIDLSDSLHRHNLVAQGRSMGEAHRLTLAQGDQWLRDHNLLIESMPVPASLIRWDHWLSHPDFNAHLDAFRKAAETQPEFRDALLQDIHEFNQRRDIDPASVSPLQRQHSLNYLLEELAAHSLLYAQTPCAVVYPGKDHESFKLVRQGKVCNVPDGHGNTCFTRMVLYSFGVDSKPETHPASINQNQAA